VRTGKGFELGNLTAKRDWGYAPDYVKGMWMMLQTETPDDYILSTGETHTVRDFIDECIKQSVWNGMFEWEGDVLMSNSKIVINTSDKFIRPAEVDILIGDSSKAKNILGWVSETDFQELVRKMSVK
jgi:GDPmannose 4,6-dehydratase